MNLYIIPILYDEECYPAQLNFLEKINIMDHENEYISTEDSEEVWKHTSKWRQFQIITLKLKYVNSSIKDIIGINDIQNIIFPEDVERILLSNVFIGSESANISLNKTQRKFYNRVIQIHNFVDEPPVDSVARDLLDCTDYESMKLHFRPKPKMRMTWRLHNISSESDYGVFSGMLKGQNRPEYLLLVEDKCPGYGGALRSERQLSGEMLLAAYNRAELSLKDQEVFGIIMKGDGIRFYRCIFSEDYLRDIFNDKWPQEEVEIFRYPPDNERSFSISHPQQRETIIRILCAIREHLEEVIA